MLLVMRHLVLTGIHSNEMKDFVATKFIYTGCGNKKDPIAKIAITPMFLGEFLYFLHQW